MARITGGEVTYMERRKIGDYEHKEAKAVLTFSLDEGDDPDSMLDGLSLSAKNRVHEMLGLIGKASPSAPPVPTRAAVLTPEAQAAVGMPVASPLTQKPMEAPVKRGPGRPPKVQAAPAVVETPKTEEAPAPDTTKPAPTEAPVEDLDLLLDEPAPEIKKIEPDPVTEVTDADLLSAVTAKMKKTNNPIAIKDVVRKTLTAAGIVNHTGKQVRDIPMSHRPIFLEHLGAL